MTREGGIVGGGISGLSCAYYLGRGGIGGHRFRSRARRPDRHRERRGMHPRNADRRVGSPSKPWAEQLIRELGMGDQITGSNDARAPHIRPPRGPFRASARRPANGGSHARYAPIMESRSVRLGTKMRMGTEIFRSPKSRCRIALSRNSSRIISARRRSITSPSRCSPGSTAVRPTGSARASVLPKFVEYEQRFGSVVVGTFREKRKPEGHKAGAPSSLFRSLRMEWAR